jgi:hypothetical protein
MSGSWRSEPLPPGWQRVIQPAVLRRDPVCTWGTLPGEDGPCGAASTDADHIGGAGNHDMAFLRGLCHDHHVKRSAGQARAERARIRSLRLRPVQRHPGWKRES